MLRHRLAACTCVIVNYKTGTSPGKQAHITHIMLPRCVQQVLDIVQNQQNLLRLSPALQSIAELVDHPWKVVCGL